MTNDDITSKQVAEEFTMEADFSKNMASGETITLGSCTVSAADKDGTDVSFGQPGAILTNSLAIASSTTGLTVKVVGGSVAAQPYTVTFFCVTDTGNKWELDITLGIT